MLEILSKQDQLWRQYALKICGCTDKSNDLVNDMYLKLHNHKGEISKRLVYTVIRNILIDDIRKQKKINTVSIEDCYSELKQVEDDNDLDRRYELLDILKRNCNFWEREVLLLTHEFSLRESEKEADVPYYTLNYYKKKALKKIIDNESRRTG